MQRHYNCHHACWQVARTVCVQCVFYFTNAKECAHKIILGQTWMHKHKFYLDWDKCMIQLSFGSQRVTIAAAGSNTTTKSSSRHSASIPTQALTKKPHCSPRYNHTPRCTIHKRLVSKHVLQAQGYYEGNAVIWVPKCHQHIKQATGSFSWSDPMHKIPPSTLVAPLKPAPLTTATWVHHKQAMKWLAKQNQHNATTSNKERVMCSEKYGTGAKTRQIRCIPGTSCQNRSEECTKTGWYAKTGN